MRVSVKIAAALAVTLLVAGCGDAPDSGSSDADGLPTSVPLADDYDPDAHLTWAHNTFAFDWDPIRSVTGADLPFFDPVYDRLLNQTGDGEIVPMLTEEFTPAEDNKSITLKLRDGLTYSDGTPFDAESVKFNLERTTGPDSKISGEVYQLESVEVIDPLTVKINVTGSLGSLVTALAARPGIMVSPAAAKSGALDKGPVGIGPYQVTNSVPGDKVDYEKTPDYWDPDAQHVATITYYLMTDDQTRINALKTGELDGAQLSGDQINTALNSDFNVISKAGSPMLYFAVNTDQEPFGDPEVRKALNMAVDREAVSQGLFDGYCTPQIQPFPADSPGYSKKIGDGLDVFPYDPAQAKEILESKGVTSLDVRVVTPVVTLYTAFGEVLQQQLKEIGLNIEVRPLSPVEQVQQFSIDKTAKMFESATTGINDPDALYGRYVSPEALFNPGNEEYPELNEYAAAGAADIDPAKRAPHYEDYMDAWVESPPHFVPVCSVELAQGFTDKISGLDSPNGRMLFRNVAKSE
ncbi:ABC transporter substrate-binding protein [Cumulibacter soli]|uniref:ABC transporter substrate-binding protein n=1 Tax=Cumulibacter soli TaxID=2546344 RepID=UPI001068CA79|nr:ABC transporter substrate-binding protein [Cumulibacter soli]